MFSKSLWQHDTVCQILYLRVKKGLDYSAGEAYVKGLLDLNDYSTHTKKANSCKISRNGAWSSSDLSYNIEDL